MPVHLAVHVVAGQEHPLDRVDSVPVERQRRSAVVVGSLRRLYDLPQVELAVLDPTVVTVAQQVVELVDVCGAGHDVALDAAAGPVPGPREQVGDPLACVLAQGLADRLVVADDRGGDLLVDVTATGEILEHHLADVRERPVPEVVAQCGEPDLGLVLGAHPQGVRKPACYVARPDAVLEPGMSGTGVDKVGHRELLHAAQPLERRAVHDPPLGRLDRDQAVHGVPDLRAAHPCPSGPALRPGRPHGHLERHASTVSPQGRHDAPGHCTERHLA